MQNLQKPIAFLVLSCDKYSDLWEGFFQSINKFWKNCSYETYLISNKKSIDYKNIHSLLIGSDETWSIGLKIALKKIKEDFDYVIITLEDLFLTNNVNDCLLSQVVDTAISQSAKYVRLHRNLLPDSSNNKLYTPLKRNEIYRFNCTYSLWNITYLLSILRDNENAWEFEYNSPLRAKKDQDIYIVNKTIFKYSNTVIKGKWVPSEKRIVNKLFPNYVINREEMSSQEEREIKSKEHFFTVIKSFLPNFLIYIIILLNRKLVQKK